MAHQKVYGICEDKCKVEVPTGPGQIAVITTPNITAEYFGISGGEEVSSVTAHIDYPEGFTADNCLVIGIKEQWKYGEETISDPMQTFVDDSDVDGFGKLLVSMVKFGSDSLQVTRRYLNGNLYEMGQQCGFNVILYRYK